MPFLRTGDQIDISVRRHIGRHRRVGVSSEITSSRFIWLNDSAQQVPVNILADDPLYVGQFTINHDGGPIPYDVPLSPFEVVVHPVSEYQATRDLEQARQCITNVIRPRYNGREDSFFDSVDRVIQSTMTSVDSEEVSETVSDNAPAVPNPQAGSASPVE